MFRQIFSFPSVRKGSKVPSSHWALRFECQRKRKPSIGASVFGCQGSDCSPSSVSQCACAVAIFAPLGCFSHASLFAVCLPPLVGVLYDQGTAAAGCSRLLFSTQRAYQTHRRSQVLPTGPDYTIESRQKQPVRESHHLLFLHNDLSKAQLEHIHPLNPDRINKPAHHIAKKYKHS